MLLQHRKSHAFVTYLEKFCMGFFGGNQWNFINTYQNFSETYEQKRTTFYDTSLLRLGKNMSIATQNMTKS